MIETQVIDDFLPKQFADEIEDLLLTDAFPWFFKGDVTYGSYDASREKNIPGFSHFFLTLEGDMSAYYLGISPLPFIGKVKLPPSKISQARAFLQVASNVPQNEEHNYLHVDRPFPHIVLLYYVNDSEGDTVLTSTNKEDTRVTKRVSPKKNRALIFDGAIYHASSRPQNSHRCIINFNLIPY
jgi:hypothetical protein